MIMALLNFFYAIDDKENCIDNQWEISHTGNTFLDSFLKTYLIGLGEFSTSGYGNGQESIVVWIFFIGATFIMLTIL
jgi:hypothetical protein